MEFSEFLLKLRDGKETNNISREVEIPASMLVDHGDGDGISKLTHETFPNLNEPMTVSIAFEHRANLAPTKEAVDAINNMMIEMYQGEEYV